MVDIAEWVFVSMIPAVGLALLFFLLGRWSMKHDRMTGSTRDMWSTMGGQSRSYPSDE